jgi:hypothetical protein
VREDWHCTSRWDAQRQRCGGVEVAGGLLAESAAPPTLELAVRLLGAAVAKRRAWGLPLPPAEAPEYGRDHALVRSRMSADAFARAWSTAQATSLE